MINLVKNSEVFERTESEIENVQEIVPFEIDSDNSDDENNDIQSNKKSLPYCSDFSEPLTKTLGSILTSSNSLSIKATPSGTTLNGVPVRKFGNENIKKERGFIFFSEKPYTNLYLQQVITVKT